MATRPRRARAHALWRRWGLAAARARRAALATARARHPHQSRAREAARRRAAVGRLLATTRRHARARA
eukprot:2066548-Prymnesium_polylepis.1